MKWQREATNIQTRMITLPRFPGSHPSVRGERGTWRAVVSVRVCVYGESPVFAVV